MRQITNETAITPAELAAVLGITSRRIHQLVEDGIIMRSARGRFNLADCVQKYAAFKSSTAADGEALRLNFAQHSAETQLKMSRAAISKPQADEMKSIMFRAEDVAAITEDLIYEIRDALVALPGRLAADVAAANTAAEASEVIRKEVHKVMRELSNYHYDPKKYEERVRARIDWSEREAHEN